MTKKITDLEGRFDAALKRADKPKVQDRMATLLKRILGMHECGNNGFFSGEAVLSESVADEIRDVLKSAGVEPYNFRRD